MELLLLSARHGAGTGAVGRSRSGAFPGGGDGVGRLSREQTSDLPRDLCTKGVKSRMRGPSRADLAQEVLGPGAFGRGLVRN